MNKKVLIIDDDATTTRLVKLTLEKTGDYEVREETRGSRGLMAARQFRPDTVLLDIHMPDIDGGEVAHQLRTDPMLRHTPILFLTAMVTERETAGRALVSDAYEFQFLAKPVNGPKLIQRIEAMLM